MTNPIYILGDCVEAMASMEPDSVDAIVTDPPYGLEFMGKEWDRLAGDVLSDPTSVGGFQDGAGGNPYSRSRIRYGVGQEAQQWHQTWAIQALRVLKPGGHLVAFGGTRTHHRLMVALEDAGFEIRDTLMWLYGSGFPKSMDVGKAMDKAAGAEREMKPVRSGAAGAYHGNLGNWRPWMSNPEHMVYGDNPITEAAQQWDGWGTALKPAWEPIVLCRKPLSERTVAANVLRWGTGAINVDGTRVGTADNTERHQRGGFGVNLMDDNWEPPETSETGGHSQGRWPANLVLDEEAAVLLDEQSGERTSGKAPDTGFVRHTDKTRNAYGQFEGNKEEPTALYGDSGGASRFFYTAKVSPSERQQENGRSMHPTQKPVDLMRWLCRLVTPPGGLILDPFMGSGSTGVAALAEGFGFIGIEKEQEYYDMAVGRQAQIGMGL